MKNLILIISFLSLYVATTAQNTNDPITVYFDESRSECTQGSLQMLSGYFGNQTFPDEDYDIYIESYPDQMLSPSVSQTLNEDRSLFVSQLLMELGVKVDRVVYFKKTEHLYFDHKDIKNWNFIRIYVQGARKKGICEGPAVGFKDGQPQYVPERIEQDLKSHYVYAKQESFLKLKKGTEIRVPSEAFERLDGTPYLGRVEIETKEVLTPISSLLNDLSTMSGDRILESRGMVYINARTMDGEQLRLKEGIAVEITMPVAEGDNSGFQSFRGNLRSDGMFDWMLNENENQAKNADKVYNYYEWGELPEDEVLAIREKREAWIAERLDNGWDRRKVRQSLRRAKKRTRSANKRNKWRMKNKYNYASGGVKYIRRRTQSRGPIKMQRSYMLGMTKNYWIEVESIRDMERLKISSYSLGWCNIDRFYKETGPKEELLVKSEGVQDVFLLFRNSFIVLKGEEKQAGKYFPVVPADEEVLVVSVGQTKDGKPQFGIVEAITGKGEIEATADLTMDKKKFTQTIERYSLYSAPRP